MDVNLDQLARLHRDHRDVREDLAVDRKQHEEVTIEEAQMVVQVDAVLRIDMRGGGERAGPRRTVVCEIEQRRVS